MTLERTARRQEHVRVVTIDVPRPHRKPSAMPGRAVASESACFDHVTGSALVNSMCLRPISSPPCLPLKSPPSHLKRHTNRPTLASRCHRRAPPRQPSIQRHTRRALQLASWVPVRIHTLAGDTIIPFVESLRTPSYVLLFPFCLRALPSA